MTIRKAKRNIPNRKRKSIYDYSKEEIIDAYEECDTLQGTADKLNVWLEPLRKFFIQNGIDYTKRDKYTCDDGFFGRDTEEAFYWAGFIAADGNVEKNRNRLKIELSVEDIVHLEKFKQIIKSTAPIITTTRKETRPAFKRETYTLSRIRVSSEQIIKDLQRFNIVPAKSKIYDIPNWLFLHPMLNHFMRGLIDGDGWSYIEEGSSNVGVCGSHISMEKIRKFFETSLSHVNFVKKKKISCIWCTNLADNTKIINYLWKDATIWLDRKHEVQQQILQIVPRKIDISREILVEMFKTEKQCIKIAEKLDCSNHTVKRRLIEYGLFVPRKKVQNEETRTRRQKYYQEHKEEFNADNKRRREVQKAKKKSSNT